MENNLIEINNTNGIQAVSARELHEKLGIKTAYKDWFPRMLEYGFEENKDFLLVAQKRATNNPKNPIATYTEHFISLDMAKEICMLQRSDIGRKFRRYFIECEKKVKAGNDGKVLEQALKWNILRYRPNLKPEQVDIICRLLPLCPTLCYTELAKLADVSIDTLRRVRKQINAMKEVKKWKNNFQ